MSCHPNAFMSLNVYFSDEAFTSGQNNDQSGKVHMFKSILQFLISKISQRVLHRSMVPEMFSESMTELKKITFRLNYLSEVLVFAQKVKELVNPESRLYVYQHVVGVMYHHKVLNERTVKDISFVAIACSGFPIEQGFQVIEALVNQTKEDNNNVLAMAATLASFVKRVVPKMKYYNTEAKQRTLADEISKRIIPPADCLVCYDLVVMANAIFGIINDNITSFCNLYQKHLNPDEFVVDSVFLPVDFQSKLDAMVEEAACECE